MEDHKGSLHLTDSPAGGAIVRLHLIGDPITDATDSDVQGENPLSR
jgi:hypothetical protein